MRDILFKGKSLWDGKWVEGFYIHISEGEGTYDREHHYIQTDYKGQFGPRYEVIPETVGQYIGKCDKNGNRIFEGDILERQYGNGWKERIVICFDESSFNYYNINSKPEMGDPIDDSEYGTTVSDYKVIGNIHDKKEK